MGISIAPGGGVGLVPLNQAAAPTRGRTAAVTPNTAGFPIPPPGQPMFPNRQPVIMNAAGYAWDANTLPPATAPPQAGNAPAASTSVQPAASTSITRRREQPPTGNGAANTSAFGTTTTAARERFTRGLSERLRAFQGAINTNNEPVSTTSAPSTAPPAAATGANDTSRPRAWERLFGRDAQATTPGAEVPPEENVRPAVSVPEQTADSSNGTRGYMSVAGRSNGSQRSAALPPAPTDLSGMVRNNLVLAQQQQATTAAMTGQWWRVAGSGSTPGTNGADDMGVD